MTKTYSIKKGLLKGVVSVLIVVASVVAFAGFSDITIWGLLEQYLKPGLGSLTVGGLVAMAINWAKFRLTV